MSNKTKSRSGEFRRKRSDTLVKNIEKSYKIDFGVRDDMQLGTYLKKKGLSSLAKALNKVTKKK